MRRAARALALGVLLLLGLWIGSGALVAWALTRRPRPPFAEPGPQVGSTAAQPLRISTSDGVELGGWLYEIEGPKLSVLLLHGNRGSRSQNLDLIRFMTQQGVDTMAISFRAHGDSTGERNNFGYDAQVDVIAAVDFLETRFPGQPIVIVGRSLGAAAAIYASGTLGSRVRGYALESPYLDLRSAALNRTSMFLPRPLNRVAYRALLLWAERFLGVPVDRISPGRAIRDLPATASVLFLAGALDVRARLSEIKQLRDQLRGASRLVVFRDAAHSELYTKDPDQYEDALRTFLQPLINAGAKRALR